VQLHGQGSLSLLPHINIACEVGWRGSPQDWQRRWINFTCDWVRDGVKSWAPQEPPTFRVSHISWEFSPDVAMRQCWLRGSIVAQFLLVCGYECAYSLFLRNWKKLQTLMSISSASNRKYYIFNGWLSWCKDQDLAFQLRGNGFESPAVLTHLSYAVCCRH